MAKKDKEAGSVADARASRIAAICGNINKSTFGGDKHDAVTWLGSRDGVEMERFSSGDMGLNEALGGGWPRGRFIEVYGPEAGGKSTLTLHAIAEFQKQYPDEDCALIDTEFCLAKGTLVYDAENMVYTPVEDFLGKTFMAYSWVGNEMKPQKAKVAQSKTRPVYLVRCSNGRKIRLTDRHRVLTQDGYKEVRDVVAGDTMYTPYKLDHGEKDIQGDKDTELYRILGYHIGDGTIEQAEIATIDNAVVEDLNGIADRHNCSVSFNGTLARFRKKDLKFYDITKESLISMFDKGLLIDEVALKCGCSVPTIARRVKEFNLDKRYNFKKMAAMARNSRDTDIEKTKSEYHGGVQSEIHNFLCQFDCFDKYSHQRTLPKGLNLKQLAQVLSGMFMADGCVVDSEKQHRCSLYYSTTSRVLALDVQAALQRIGVFTAISEYVKAREDGCGFYRMSYSVWVNGHRNVELFNKFVQLYGYKKERIEAALSSVSPAKSRNKAENRGKGLIPVEVLSVEADGIAETYDVSVNNTTFEEQNFLAEGLIVHNTFDEFYAQRIGVNTKYLIVHQPDGGEQALNVLKLLVQQGVKLIVVDSVAALNTKAEREGDIGDSHVGEQARLMSQALRQLAAECGRNNATVFWTNQLRDKIGAMMWGEKTTTPAGKALPYYASIRAYVVAIGKVKEGTKEEPIVVCTKNKVSIRKNKTSAPFKEAEFCISFGYGIDRIAAVLDMAIEMKVIVKKGSWFSMGTEQLGQGRKEVLDMMRNDPVRTKQIEDAIQMAKSAGVKPEIGDDVVKVDNVRVAPDVSDEASEEEGAEAQDV